MLQPDEVLVRNHVAGLNPVDWKALGTRLAPWGPGWVPGVDGAGIVVAVGRDVESECLGRRVAYHQSLMRPGSFAEYTPVRLRALIDLPRTLDFETAAGVPCPALTAWLALVKFPSRTGDTLLIDPHSFLPTVQVGMTLVSILEGTFGGSQMESTVTAWIANIPSLRPIASEISIDPAGFPRMPRTRGIRPARARP